MLAPITPSTKPTQIKLKGLLKRSGVSQAELARHVGMSVAAMCDLINKGKRPVKQWEVLKSKIEAWLRTQGISESAIATAFQHRAIAKKTAAPKKKAQRANVEPSHQPSPKCPPEGVDMLLRKNTLTKAAEKHFGLFRDPFREDVTCADDVFESRDIALVKAAMWYCVKHGGLLGVVGESGAGKSTLRRDLSDRLIRENANVIVIEPYVLAMEENDIKGKTLKSAQIAESIIRAISPLEKPKRGSEARFHQLHSLLKESHRAGNSHVMIIEEAHSLPTATLKHLKRFFELEDGFKNLLSIILIGQPELRQKLSEKNPEVREVVQRIELVELAPLDNNLAEYIDFKFKRIGVPFDQVFEKDAVDAIRAKLTFNQSAKGRASFGASATSLLYPLVVANVIAAAMNLAADLGAPKVNADLIKEV